MGPSEDLKGLCRAQCSGRAGAATPVRVLFERDCPASREEAIGIGRTLAAYHLDRLAEAGLLTVTYQRPAARGGPGGGRPAKLYRLAERGVRDQWPPRAYDLPPGRSSSRSNETPPFVPRCAAQRKRHDDRS